MTALPQFPILPGLTFPVIRRNLGFDVIKLQSVSGIRSRIDLRNIPQYQWELSFEFLRDSGANGNVPFSDLSTFSDGSEFAQTPLQEMQTLFGFYNQCYGPKLPFLYTDVLDNAATANTFGIGDGTSTSFQLARTFGGFTEPVFAPVGTPAITIAGVVTTSFSISQTGLVTFYAPPGAGLSLAWTGTFSWICRFDDDVEEFSNFMSGFWELKKLTFSNEILP